MTGDLRFWTKVAPAAWDECWLWTAGLNDSGYGKFRYRGRAERAHRVAYELMIGPIPDGLQLDHLCRVRRCVNPYHLDPVTTAVNTQRGDHSSNNHMRKRTHCPSGHTYSPENTWRRSNGNRICRTCAMARSVEYRQHIRSTA